MADLRQAFGDGDLLGTCHVFAEEVTVDWVMLDDSPRIKFAISGRGSEMDRT